MTLDEKVFSKMGFKFKNTGYNLGLYGPDETYYGTPTPPISSSWEVCAEYLVPFMRERNYRYQITKTGDFWWESYSHKDEPYGAEIIDHKISEAACKAFMEVEL